MNDYMKAKEILKGTETRDRGKNFYNFAKELCRSREKGTNG